MNIELILCTSNTPVWGLDFYINSPMSAPIVPGRGVVGFYIDRCITTTYHLEDFEDMMPHGVSTKALIFHTAFPFITVEQRRAELSFTAKKLYTCAQKLSYKREFPGHRFC